MAQRTRIEINHAAMAELLKSEAVERILTGPAQAVMQRAITSAPVATGEYRDSIQLKVVRTDRVVVQVIATAAHSHALESKLGILARALGGS
jgi:hypothetical protein